MMLVAVLGTAIIAAGWLTLEAFLAWAWNRDVRRFRRERGLEP